MAFLAASALGIGSHREGAGLLLGPAAYRPLARAKCGAHLLGVEAATAWFGGPLGVAKMSLAVALGDGPAAGSIGGGDPTSPAVPCLGGRRRRT